MKKIIHVDMDAFYAAIEVRDNPKLKGLPVAVGGEPERRGVIAAASYEARRYGVKSAVSSARAKLLCPGLIIVPPGMKKYKEESLKIREIFSRFTDISEPLSLDEAYLDVTGSIFFKGSATLMA
ncbi:MAG: DNA polymerase IV, partial [Nitrospinota bacterium]